MVNARPQRVRRQVTRTSYRRGQYEIGGAVLI
jgi:hypothetical protein